MVLYFFSGQMRMQLSNGTESSHYRAGLPKIKIKPCLKKLKVHSHWRVICFNNF